LLCGVAEEGRYGDKFDVPAEGQGDEAAYNLFVDAVRRLNLEKAHFLL
jgi:hypothetical protein